MAQKRDSKTGRYTLSKETPPTARESNSPEKVTQNKGIAAQRKSILGSMPKTLRVQAHSPISIPTDAITEGTRYAYRNGQCFTLAIVLAEKHNTDIGLLVEISKIPWGTREDDPKLLEKYPDWFNEAYHAVALMENSVEDKAIAIDIDGSHNMISIRKQAKHIPDLTMIRVTPDSLRQRLANHRNTKFGTKFYKQNYCSAEIVAELIK